MTRSLCKILRGQTRAGPVPKKVVRWNGKKYVWCIGGKQAYNLRWKQTRGSEEREGMVKWYGGMEGSMCGVLEETNHAIEVGGRPEVPMSAREWWSQEKRLREEL